VYSYRSDPFVTGQKLITHSTLKNIQGKLPVGKFIQPHKSYLVALAQIRSIEGNTLQVGSSQIPISKYPKEKVMEKILKNNLLKNE